MFIITGVTGNTGRIVATTLLEQGQPVRVVVRDAAQGATWKQRGAEVAVAALEDTAALTRAFTGGQGAYVLLPPKPTSTDPLGDNRAVVASIRAAVVAAKVPHVVLLSSIGAQHERGTGPIQSLHHAERELGAVTALTAVRAAYFADNWKNSLGILPTLPTFLPAGLAIPTVSTRDIGRVAAAALVEGPRGRQIIELTGPRDVSAKDVAAAVEQVTGKPVTVAEAPLDAVVPTFTGFGLSAPVAENYREMYAGIISGHVVHEGGSARSVRGTVGIEDAVRGLLG